MELTLSSDPKKFGPGLWHKIHTDAITATTDWLKEAFIININVTCDSLPCVKCKTHLREFIDKYPLRNYWNTRDEYGKDIGFFKWTWILHNRVNKFLGKFEPKLEDAYLAYRNINISSCARCNNSDIHPSARIIITKYKTGDVKPREFKLIKRH